MRTIPILIIAAIALASTATAYYFLADHEWAKRAEEATPSIGSASTSDGQNAPIRDGRRDQQAHLEQPGLTRLQAQLAALEARLRHTETAVREQAEQQAVSKPAKPVSSNGADPANTTKRLRLLQAQLAALEARLRHAETAVREQAEQQAVSEPADPISTNGAENATTRNLAEANFAQWMDAALDAGDFDRDATASVMEQAATSVATVPGINLADLQCGARFCRATFIPETGEPLNIAELVGASPFIGEASTFHGPDGSVSVYFVQPGESFSDLRSQAQATAR